MDISPETVAWLLEGDPAIRWQVPYAGLVYFHIEKAGQPSGWNALRALRVLKWWRA